MKCVICQRQLRAAYTLLSGGRPIGPTCARLNGIRKDRRAGQRKQADHKPDPSQLALTFA